MLLTMRRISPRRKRCAEIGPLRLDSRSSARRSHEDLTATPRSARVSDVSDPAVRPTAVRKGERQKRGQFF
jgi:hypothetical protein